MGRSHLVFALVVALGAASAAGCHAGPGTAAVRRDAGPQAPPPPPFDVTDDRLDLVALEAVVDGQVEALKPGDGPIPVPADATLRLQTWQRLTDVRLRLATSHDHLVPFDLETGPVVSRHRGPTTEPGGTWFKVTPRPPLEPGKTYRLELEGERAPHITDAEGRHYQDLTLQLEATAPAPDAPDAADAGPAAPHGG